MTTKIYVVAVDFSLYDEKEEYVKTFLHYKAAKRFIETHEPKEFVAPSMGGHYGDFFITEVELDKSL